MSQKPESELLLDPISTGPIVSTNGIPPKETPTYHTDNEAVQFPSPARTAISGNGNGNGQGNGSTPGSPMKLKRSIGLLHGVAIIVGVIVGSGIFVSPVGVLRNVNSIGLSLILWLVCGLFSIIGALCYAEIGTTIPRSGGEYIYILKTLGHLPAFLSLWIMFVTIGAVACGCNSLVFSIYILKPIFGDCDIPPTLQKLIAFIVIVFLAAINSMNVKWATKVALIFTITKVAALIMVIVLGLYSLFFLDHPLKDADFFADSDFSLRSLALAFYSGFWAFAGWNYLNYLTEELENPTRNLPLAIIISLTLVIVIYLLANVAYLAVLTPPQMLESAAVALTFAKEMMGPFQFIMPILVAASVFGSVNGEILSISRAFMTGAYEGHLPSVIAMINYKFLTPLSSVLILTIFAIFFLFFGDVFYLIDVTGFASCLVIAATIAGLIYYRHTCPDAERPIKLPIVIPYFLLIWTIFICIITVIQQPKEASICLAIILTGIPTFWFGVCWKDKPQSFMTKWNKIVVLLQKFLLIIPQDKQQEEK